MEPPCFSGPAERVCAICLEAGGAFRRTPCGHHFHGACLARWEAARSTCPVCRQALAPRAADTVPHAGATRMLYACWMVNVIAAVCRPE